MDKLSIIRLGIENTKKAIKELEDNLLELRVMEQIAMFEEELKEDFPL